MNDDRTGYLLALAVACILAYLLVVTLTPTVDAITATPTPTVDILGLWPPAQNAGVVPNPAVVPNNANNGDLPSPFQEASELPGRSGRSQIQP